MFRRGNSLMFGMKTTVLKGNKASQMSKPTELVGLKKTIHHKKNEKLIKNTLKAVKTPIFSSDISLKILMCYR